VVSTQSTTRYVEPIFFFFFFFKIKQRDKFNYSFTKNKAANTVTIR
jgi:hypothetical protein